MPRLFGTDGVRGVANRDLTPDLALALGRAAGRVLASAGEVVVGRDTRLSGPMLEGALVAGLCSAGVDVQLAGIVPTPAVSFLTVEDKMAAGAVISASHNPVADNGIKFFNHLGVKLPAELEDQVEATMALAPDAFPTGMEIGRIRRSEDAADRYVEHLTGTLDVSPSGVRVVLDCAFGAAYRVAPLAFRTAGTDVVAINDEADGGRINVDCGSTSLEGLAGNVVEQGAHLGLAFDGDADRVLAVDDRGRAVDGDRILGMLALDMHARGALDNDVVVATVMSNLGFRRALAARGIEVVLTPVGDRFVAEAMARRQAVIGGEQSGHLILSRHAPTGDGILTGLHVAAAVAASGEPLSSLVDFFEPFPQVLINVPVAHKERLDESGPLWEDVRASEETLGDDGRVLVRASGTEPIVRVMVEAADEAMARAVAESLADRIGSHLG